MTRFDIPHYVWAVAEVKHADHGWHDELRAFLVLSCRRWRWKLQAKTAGVKPDHAMKVTNFPDVPTAMEWARKTTFMRNVEQLREWT